MVSAERKIGGGKACMVVIGIFLGLMVLVMIAGQKNGSRHQSNIEISISDKTIADPGNSPATPTETPKEYDISLEKFTPSQKNVAIAAKETLNMGGYSREQLIYHLSSDAGYNYPLEDSIAAVDKFNIDWNENAVKSAKFYLGVSKYTCQDLIEELSSIAEYTVDQATYGAHQAGAC